MQTVCADRRVPEPAPGNLGDARGPERRSENNKAVEEFAQNMSGSIMESLTSQSEADFSQNYEMFGEELASALIDSAVMEASRGGHVKGHEVGSELDQTFVDEAAGGEGVWRQFDLVTELQAHGRPPLTQAGLPAVGSLDYPDAPPTTPLFPELQESRKNFSQKLKGGLARVFQPSPPPPTPKDREGISPHAMGDHQAALAELLMDSLSTDDVSRDDSEPRRAAGVEDFANALSLEIMDCVLGLKNSEQMAEDTDLHLLAQQMAETIIASSLDAAKMSVF